MTRSIIAGSWWGEAALRSIVVLALLLAAPALAASRDGKKQVVRFDGDTIDGSLMRPDGDLFQSRPELDLPSLVVPPKSFDRASRHDLVDAADAVKKR